ncbi:MAG TPA: 4a-hydroxytetrahydrobiopterin dehydratase [Pirellulales bacterium]|jgi:4a-hydroxytetrahydrobiopterin dehydratase|nr:4a-hydroxytetrahydrobiopterin dehydratase [Pirellulales bacterium]
MPTETAEKLSTKKCTSCDEGGHKYSRTEAEAQLKNLSGWQLTHDAERIRKNWTVKDFLAGIEFFQAVAQLAEAEDHHPDLHLEGYRNLSIELWTHAVGGLSENDFILAAKIDRLPIKLKKST